jgi:putative FmdB family regulatory protein
MPIFEYVCRQCSKEFEALVRGDAEVQCPVCSSKKLDKQLSVFAAATTNGTKVKELAQAPCGSCGDPRGPGSCSLN